MIEFVNVNKEYNHGVKALDNINIKIENSIFWGQILAHTKQKNIEINWQVF